MGLSKYHPFYSDDVPFASLPCALRIASPACAMATGVVLPGEALGLQEMLHRHRPYRHPTNLAASRISYGGPACLAALARAAWGTWQGDSVLVVTLFTCRSNKYCCLSSNWLVGRASPATRCQEVPPSTASTSFTLIVNKIARGTR